MNITEQKMGIVAPSLIHEDYIQCIILMSIVLSIFILFKAIVVCCPCFYFINDPSLKDAIYVLFREVFIMITCLLIFEALNYYGVLSFLSIDTSGFSYTVLMTLFIWALLGFIFAIAAQK